MKRTILITFLFVSLFSFSQTPQRFNKVIVTGDITSPKFIKTGSTGDSVLLGNGSARAISTIKIDTTSLSNRISTKQEILVSGTNIRTVNGNSVLGSGDIQIASGGGGSPVNNYLSNVNSVVSGYKEARPDIDVTETVKTITATPANTITWGEKYLYTSPVSTTIVPSGFWELHAYGHISTSTGVSKLVFRVLRYSGSTETILATFTGFEVNNTTDAELFVNGSTNDITVLAGDYLGIQVGFLSDGTSPARTLTYTIGDGNASHFNTPLPTRHSALRDKNGEVDFQHLTAAQVTKVDATSGVNTGDETTATIKSKLGFASSASSGYLKNTDWVNFDNKQPAGNYSTDYHSNITALNAVSGINTGDETLTSIKTKLGVATAFSDGYLKYQDWSTFNDKQPRLNGSGFVKSFSGEITYDANNYEIAFSKNSGFNLPLGNTPGTVLEGRTFGTAANSAVGDFQPIENQRLSTINSPSFLNSTTINSTTSSILELNNTAANGKNWKIQAFSDGRLYIGATGQFNHYIDGATGAAIFASTVNSTGFLLNGNNLTSSLSTNYIPKWNGSNLVNATAGTDYQLPITLTTTGTSGAATFENGVMNIPNYGNGLVNQTQTTVNGSTSGTMVCSMPFQTGTYKKVYIKFNSLLGSASYTYPVPFSVNWQNNIGGGLTLTGDIVTNITVTTSSPQSGWLIIEGY